MKSRVGRKTSQLLVLVLAVMMTITMMNPVALYAFAEDSAKAQQEQAQGDDQAKEQANEKAAPEAAEPEKEARESEAAQAKETESAEEVASEADRTKPSSTKKEESASEPEKEAEEADAEDARDAEFPAFEQSAEVDGVKVTATADEGTFPEGAKLVVRSATKAEEKKADKLVEEARDTDRNVATSYTFDISVVDKDGNELQPKDGKSVQIAFKTKEVADKDLTTEVFHINDDSGKAESLDVSEFLKTAKVEVDGFSLYVITFADDGTTITDPQTVVYNFYESQDDVDEEKVFHSQTVKAGDTLYMPSTPNVPKNSCFVGWYIDGDGNDESKKLFADDQNMTISTLPTGNVTVIAVSKMNHYATFYDDEDGSTIVTRKKIEEGSVVIGGDNGVKVQPATAHKRFIGWKYKGAADSERLTHETLTGLTEDIELVPVFESGIWINFNKHCDDANIHYTPSLFVPTGSTPQAALDAAGRTIPDPGRNGYTLGYWSTDKDSDEVVGDSEAEPYSNAFNWSNSSLGTDNITLYARYNKGTAKYSVAVWKQNVDGDGYDYYDYTSKLGGSNIQTAATGSTVNLATDDERLALTTNDATKTDFTGFYLDKYDTNVEVKGDNSSVINIYYNRKTVTFYFYDKTGGSSPTGSNYKSDFDAAEANGKAYSVTGPYGSSLTGGWPSYGVQGNKAVTTGSGKANSWFFLTSHTGTSTTNNGGLKVLSPSEKAYNYAADLRHDPDKCIDVYFATVEKFSGSLTYDYLMYVEDSEGASGIQTQSCEGRSFGIAGGIITNGTGNGVIVANKFYGYHPYKYRLGGTGNWEDTPEVGKTIWNNDRKKIEILFAKNESEIVFVDSMDTSLEARPSQSRKYLDDISGISSLTPVDSITHEGYVFKGWYLDEECHEKFNLTKMPGYSIRLFAGWKPVHHYVQVELNGGTLVENSDLAKAREIGGLHTFHLAGLETVNEDTLTEGVVPPEGYKLAGWTNGKGKIWTFTGPVTDEDCEKTVAVPEDKQGEYEAEELRSMTLKPVWHLIGTIRVDYDAGTGTLTASDSNTYQFDEDAQAVVYGIAEAPAGQRFVCWTDEKGNEYETGDMISLTKDIMSIDNNGDGTVTLRAKYEGGTPVTNITYNANYTGADQETKVSNDYGFNDVVKLEGSSYFTRDGYALTGWATSADGEKKYNLGQRVMIDDLTTNGGNTLYAVWKKHTHDWSYAANEDTITATCGNSDGAHTGNTSVTLKISAAGGTYDGTTSFAATLSDKDGAAFTNENVEDIHYKGTGSTEYDDTTTAPVGAGTYEASVKVGEAIARTQFTVEPAAAPDPSTLTDAQKPAAAKTEDGKDPTYNGQDQQLVTAPTGTLPEGYSGPMYSLDGENWTNDPAEITGKDAGPYTVHVKYVGDNNHADFMGDDITATIAKAPLTVTAKPKTIKYGEAAANDGVEYSGFVNNETESVLDGSVAYAYKSKDATPVDYAAGSSVGTYSIVPSGLSSKNYDITFNAGDLTVSKRSLTVPALTVENKSYDGNTTATVDTAVIFGGDGVYDSDDVALTATGTFDTPDAGTGKTVTIRGLELSGAKASNYELSNPGDQTTTANITAKVLTDEEIADDVNVTVDSNTHVYNGQKWSPTVSAVTYGGNSVTFETDADTLNNIDANTGGGTYELTVTLTGNYSGTKTVSYTITPKQVTVTGPTVYVPYKGTAASISGDNCNVVGLIDDNDKSSLKLQVSGTYDAEANIGATTPIVVSQGENPNTNYAVTPVEGQYIISKAPATVIVNDATFVYDADPHNISVEVKDDRTANIIDLLKQFITGNTGDKEATVYYSTSELTSPTGGNPDFGITDVTPEEGTTVYYYIKFNGHYEAVDSNNNHFDSLAGHATLKITKATQKEADLNDNQKPSGKIGNDGLTYNGSVQELITAPTAEITGYTVKYSTDGGNTWLTEIPKETNANEAGYTVKVKYEAKNDNYTTFYGEDIVVPIAKKEVGLTWENTTLTYNGSPQLPTATATGLEGQDTCTVTVDVTGEHANAGDYTATATALSNTNYKLPTDVTQTFKIEAKSAANELTDEHKAEGQPDGALTYNGAAQNLLASEPQMPVGYDHAEYSINGGAFSSDLPTGVNQGTYTIQVRYVPADTNHAEFVASDAVTVKIAKKTLTVTWPAKTELPYNASDQTYAEADIVTGIVDNDEGDVTVNISGNTGKAVDNYTAEVSISDGLLSNKADNYQFAAGTTIKNWSIIKADASDGNNGNYTAPTAKSDLIYNGKDQALVTAGTVKANEGQMKYYVTTSKLDDGAAVTDVPAGGWSYNVPEKTNAGTYYVYCYVTEGTSYNKSGLIGPIEVTIAPKSIAANDIEATAADTPYTGSDLTPSVTVVEGKTLISAGKTLESPKDYTVTIPEGANVKDYGTINLTVKGQGNYTGERQVEWKITKTPTSELEGHEAPKPAVEGENTLTYNRSPQSLVAEGTGTGKTPSEGTIMYRVKKDSGEFTEWSETKPTGTDAGTYTLEYYVKGDANHEDSVKPLGSFTVTIAPKALTAADMAVTFDGKAASNNLADHQYTYNKNEQGPEVVVKDGETTLIPTTEYTLTNATKVNAGEYTVTVAGTGNYTGTVECAYKIEKASSDLNNFDENQKPTANKPDGKNLVYNKTAQDLVSAPSAALPEGYTGVKYKLAGENKWGELNKIPTGTNAGTYVVEILYVGDADHNDVDGGTVQVVIDQKPVTVTPTATSKTYGESDPTLTYDVADVERGDTVNMTLSRVAGDAVGNYKFVIADNDNNYAPVLAKDAKFTINAKNAAQDDTLSVTLSQSTYTYNGAECEPGVTVKIGSEPDVKTLVKGIDYDLVYSNNTAAAASTDANAPTVTVNFKGNYSGTTAQTFTIEKAAAAYTAPTVKSGLKYNDNDQQLIDNAGDAKGQGSESTGTLKYFVTTSDTAPAKTAEGWTTDKYAITGKEAATYNVYYYVAGDGNHNDSAIIGPVTVAIGQKDAPALNDLTDDQKPSVNRDGNKNLVYNASPQDLVTNPAAAKMPEGYDQILYKHKKNDGTEEWTTEIPTGTNAGSYTVEYKFHDTTGNHADTATEKIESITIDKLSIENAVVTLEPTSVTYNGTAVTDGKDSNPKVEVKSVVVKVTVGENEINITVPTGDYTTSFTNNTAVAAANSENAPTVTVTAKNDAENFTGSATGKFAITAKKITADDISVSFPDGENKVVYDGTEQHPVPTVTVPNPAKPSETVELVYGTDFTVEYPTNSTDAGDYKAKIVLSGNYSGSKDEQEYTIAKRPLTVTIKDQTVTYGTAIDQSKYSVSGTATNQNATVVLNQSTTAATNGKPGKITATVTVKQGDTDVTSNYAITATPAELTIDRASLTPSALTAENKPAPISGGLTYTATNQNLVIPPATADVPKGYKLQYKLSTDDEWSDDVPQAKNAGDYTVQYKYVPIDDNHSEVTSDTFTQTVNIGKADLSGEGVIIAVSPNSYIFDGTDKEPTVTVTLNGVELPKSDYEVSYSNNKNKGTATVTVTAKADGNCINRNSTTFSINAHTVNPDDVTVTFPSASGLEYNGKPQTPDPQVVVGGKTLEKEKDYEVVYPEDSTSAGEKTAKIVFKGDYANAVDAEDKPVDITGTYNIAKKAVKIKAKDQTISHDDQITQDVGQVKATGLLTDPAHTLKSIELAQSVTAEEGNNDGKIGTIEVKNAKIEDASGTDVTNNYNITYDNTGKLTIKAAQDAPSDADKDDLIKKQETTSITINTQPGYEYVISTSPTAPADNADWSTMTGLAGEKVNSYYKENGNVAGTHEFKPLEVGTVYYVHMRKAAVDPTDDDPSTPEDESDPGKDPSLAATVPTSTKPEKPQNAEDGYTVVYENEALKAKEGFELYDSKANDGKGAWVKKVEPFEPGGTYEVRIAAKDGVVPSDGTDFKAPARPSAPDAVKISDRKDKSFTIKSSDTAQEYVILPLQNENGDSMAYPGSAEEYADKIFAGKIDIAQAVDGSGEAMTFKKDCFGQPVTPGREYAVFNRLKAVTEPADKAAIASATAGPVKAKTKYIEQPLDIDTKAELMDNTFNKPESDDKQIVVNGKEGYEYLVVPKGTSADKIDWTKADKCPADFEKSGSGDDATYKKTYTKDSNGGDIEANTDYKILVRKSENEDYMPSTPVEVPAYTTKSAPEAGKWYKIDYPNEKITAEEGYEIFDKNADDGKGKWVGVVNNAKPGETYKVRSKKDSPKEGDHESEPRSFTLADRPEATAVQASEMTKTDTTMTVNPTTKNQEYIVVPANASADDIAAAWKDSEAVKTSKDGEAIKFSNLSKATDYKVITRVPATETSFKSLEAPTAFSTKREAPNKSADDLIKEQKPTTITINTERDYEYVLTTSEEPPAEGDWENAAHYYKETAEKGTHTFGESPEEPLDAGTKYYVHVRKAATTEPAKEPSMPQTVPTSTRMDDVTPTEGTSHSFDYEAETVKAEDGYKIRTAADGENPAGEWVDGPVAFTPGQKFEVKKVGDPEGVADSDPTEFTAPTRPSAPEKVKDTDKDDKSITIKNTDTAQEYLVLPAKGNGEEYTKAELEALYKENKGTDGTGKDETFTKDSQGNDIRPGTDYVIYNRLKAVPEPAEGQKPQIASEVAGPTTVKTKTSSEELNDAEKEGLKDTWKDDTANPGSIVVNGKDGYEYLVLPKGTSADKIDWTKADKCPADFENGQKTYTEDSNGGKITADTNYDILVRKSETETAMPSKPTTVPAYTTQEPPATGEGHSEDYPKEQIKVEDGYEIRATSPTGTEPAEWTKGETYVPLTPGATYEIRKIEEKDDDGKVTKHESTPTSFTVADRPETPLAVNKDNIQTTDSAVTVDPTVSTQEYILVPADATPQQIEEAWKDAKSGNGGAISFDVTDPSKEYKVMNRVKATESAPHSNPSAITVPAAPTTPEQDKLVGEAGNDGTIKGVDETMEYSTDGGQTWTAVTGTEITGLSEGNVLVRHKAKAAEGNNPAKAPSLAKKVEVKAKDPNGQTAVEAKDVSVSATTDTITFDKPVTTDSDKTVYEYSIDGGRIWQKAPTFTEDKDGKALTPGTTYQVQVRKAETDKDMPSKATTATVTTTPAAIDEDSIGTTPTTITIKDPKEDTQYDLKDEDGNTVATVKVDKDGKIVEPAESAEGVKVEQDKDGNIKISGLEPEKKYEVTATRINEDGEAISKPSAPTGKTTPELIPEKTPKAPDVKALSDGTLKISDPSEGTKYIVKDEKGNETTVEVDKDGNVTVDPKDGSLKAKKDKDGNIIVSGLNPDREYEVRAITNSTSPDNRDSEASKPVSGKTAKSAPTTPAEKNKVSEKGNDGSIKGVDDTMEYSTDGGKTWKPVPAGKKEITGLSAGDVQVRYKSVPGKDGKQAQPASEPITVKVTRKPNNEKATLAFNAGFKVKQKGNKVTVKWGKVPGANLYEVYATYCGTFNFAMQKQVKGNKIHKISFKKLHGKKIKRKKNFKLYVVAYKVKNGKKVRLTRTMTGHIVGNKNHKFTNPKGIKLKTKKLTLKVGQTRKVKAKILKVNKKKNFLSHAHAPMYRYASSNKRIATVNAKGQVTAKKAGTCQVFVYAKNGYAKAVKVTVK